MSKLRVNRDLRAASYAVRPRCGRAMVREFAPSAATVQSNAVAAQAEAAVETETLRTELSSAVERIAKLEGP